MRVLLAILALLGASCVLAQTYTPGVAVGALSGPTGLVLEVPTPTSQVIQCTAAFVDTCTPSVAGSFTSVAIGVDELTF